MFKIHMSCFKGTVQQDGRGINVVSIGLTLYNGQRSVKIYQFFVIKGPVYNLNIKISASKQHLPFQKAGYFPSGKFF